MHGNSLLSDILDLLLPRQCCNCGRRLATTEELFCTVCNIGLPRVDLLPSFEDNDMARQFWGLVPVGRATAFINYQAENPACRFIHQMKYYGEPEIGQQVGRMMAEELLSTDFFEGIDALVPVPLTRQRQRQRGYNQSEYIARGVAEAARLPVYNHVIRRAHFAQSQTHLSADERLRNVQGAFSLCTDHWYRKADRIDGRHILLVDDVMTTGATLKACAETLMQAHPARISFLTLGLVS